MVDTHTLYIYIYIYIFLLRYNTQLFVCFIAVGVDVNKWNSQHVICRGRYIRLGMLCVHILINNKKKKIINKD